MAIIKEKRIAISSVIENLSPEGFTEGEPETTQVSSDGFLKIDGERLILSYTESREGERTYHEITVCSDGVVVSHRGSVVSDMTFREGEKTKTLYSIPPYSFDMTVLTKRIRSTLTKDGGRLDIFYEMNIGGQDKKVRMRITVS